MQTTNNIYGLSTDRAVVDSHMLTNMEWGAVAYLTHSKYGRCTNGSCTEVAINSYNGFMTGCGPQSAGSASSGWTYNPYNSELGLTSSTTGNIYGVYDMNGGANEYVMGNIGTSIGQTSGKYEYYASSAGSNYTYTESEKYLTPYAYGGSFSDQIAYNRGRLGDATIEVVASSGYAWNSDFARFPYSTNSWFVRGGPSYNSSAGGTWNFSFHTGTRTTDSSARTVLAVF